MAEYSIKVPHTIKDPGIRPHRTGSGKAKAVEVKLTPLIKIRLDALSKDSNKRKNEHSMLLAPSLELVERDESPCVPDPESGSQCSGGAPVFVTRLGCGVGTAYRNGLSGVKVDRSVNAVLMVMRRSRWLAGPGGGSIIFIMVRRTHPPLPGKQPDLRRLPLP